MASATIDVRPIEPREKHTRIFGLINDLSVGETVTIINDHDPVPLKYQIEAEHPLQYKFNYVESGPTQWVLEVTSCAHVFDARETIASGGEPFADIMKTVGDVKEGEVFVLYAPFEPVPLEGVLGEQGFTYRADELSPNNWRTIFSK